jgi:hypothetical protein
MEVKEKFKLSLFFIIPVVIVIICFNFAHNTEINNKIAEYKNNDIKMLALPNFFGCDYAFVDNKRLIYYAGNGKMMLYNIDLKKGEIIKYQNNKYKIIDMWGFEYSKNDNRVYFFANEGNYNEQVCFFSLNLSEKYFEEILELRNTIFEYRIAHYNERDVICVYDTNQITIFDLTSRQIINRFDLPDEIRNYKLCSYNPEKGFLLFFSIEYPNNMTEPVIWHYLFDMKTCEGKRFDDFVIDRNEYSFYDYLYMNDYKYLCRNSIRRYTNDFLEIDFLNNSISKIFQNEIRGEIFNLKKFTDTTVSFLAEVGKNKMYLCFFDL